MRAVPHRRPWIAPLLACLLAALMTGCDAPLKPDKLIQHLGKGDYSFFLVTFYRYAPSDMQAFAAGLAPGSLQYAYEELLLRGPLERLDLVYRPSAKKTTITRYGNDLDLEHRLTSSTTAPQRGPLESVIQTLKGNMADTRDFFARDLYAAADGTSPDYFRAVDNQVLRVLRGQSGSTPDWHFVEFTLQYRLPQPGRPVYTSESALIPLGRPTGLDSTLRQLADKHYQALPDPLVDRAY
ncbi:MAG TPA: hypothetical protein VEI97_12145 [bacterium]|nr:hypothetical protein [bacterium]